MSSYCLDPFRLLIRAVARRLPRRSRRQDADRVVFTRCYKAAYCPCGMVVPDKGWLCGPHCRNTGDRPDGFRSGGV